MGTEDYKSPLDDLYGDFESFDLGQTIENLKKENSLLRKHIATQEENIEKLANVVTELKEENTNLANNISSLFLTAKTEIERKDATIADLRREVDNFVFRRHSNANRTVKPKGENCDSVDPTGKNELKNIQQNSEKPKSENVNIMEPTTTTEPIDKNEKVINAHQSGEGNSGNQKEYAGRLQHQKHVLENVDNINTKDDFKFREKRERSPYRRFESVHRTADNISVHDDFKHKEKRERSPYRHFEPFHSSADNMSAHDDFKHKEKRERSPYRHFESFHSTADNISAHDDFKHKEKRERSPYRHFEPFHSSADNMSAHDDFKHKERRERSPYRRFESVQNTTEASKGYSKPFKEKYRNNNWRDSDEHSDRYSKYQTVTSKHRNAKSEGDTSRKYRHDRKDDDYDRFDNKRREIEDGHFFKRKASGRRELL